jgi:hypothetical protein
MITIISSLRNQVPGLKKPLLSLLELATAETPINLCSQQLINLRFFRGIALQQIGRDSTAERMSKSTQLKPMNQAPAKASQLLHTQSLLLRQSTRLHSSYQQVHALLQFFATPNDTEGWRICLLGRHSHMHFGGCRIARLLLLISIFPGAGKRIHMI